MGQRRVEDGIQGGEQAGDVGFVGRAIVKGGDELAHACAHKGGFEVSGRAVIVAGQRQQRGPAEDVVHAEEGHGLRRRADFAAAAVMAELARRRRP